MLTTDLPIPFHPQKWRGLGGPLPKSSGVRQKPYVENRRGVASWSPLLGLGLGSLQRFLWLQGIYSHIAILTSTGRRDSVMEKWSENSSMYARFGCNKAG
jgi:hypothetical protein